MREGGKAFLANSVKDLTKHADFDKCFQDSDLSRTWVRVFVEIPIRNSRLVRSSSLRDKQKRNRLATTTLLDYVPFDQHSRIFLGISESPSTPSHTLSLQDVTEELENPDYWIELMERQIPVKPQLDPINWVELPTDDDEMARFLRNMVFLP